MSLIIKRGQFSMVDVWDSDKIGWEENHTRVKIVKKPGAQVKAFFHSGKPLEKIRYVEIAKSI